MDVVSAGSSVLAFVGIALKSTEAIYKVISGIRDGPEKVERLKSAVEALRTVLNQLSDLPLQKQLTSAQLTAELEDAIRRCENDIRSFSKKLSPLQKSGSDKKWTTAWQRVKTVLKSEDLSEMLAAVTNHVTTLSAFLGVRQSIVASEQTQNISALQHTIQSQFDLMASGAQLLQQNAATLTSFAGQLKSFENHSNMAQRSTEQALDRLSQKIDAMPSFSQKQCDVIKDMLEKLSFQQGYRMQPDSSLTSCQSSTEDSGCGSDSSVISLPKPRRPVCTPSLLPSIRKLESLVDSKEKTVGSSEASDIIKELQKLLGAVCKGPLATIGEKRKRGDEDPVVSSDVKRVRGFLDTTYKVKINDEKPILRVRDPAQTIVEKTSSIALINEGNIYLRTRTRRLGGAEVREASEDNEQLGDDVLEFAANLTFMPSLPELRMKLSTSFYQRMTSDGGYLVIPPKLSIHVMVPDDSEIFSLVKNGNLEGMVRLFEQGRASLRDCDTNGRPLLSYACYAKSADICRFLVEKGADVNAEEALVEEIDLGFNVISPLWQLSYSSSLCADHSVYECSRVLLGAGADFQCEGRMDGRIAGSSPFRQMLIKNGDWLPTLLDLSHDSVNINERNLMGHNALEHTLEEVLRSGSSESPPLKSIRATFEVLRSFEADFRNTTWDRRTALHVTSMAFLHKGKDYMKENREEIVALLSNLIRHGVDVHAVNLYGDTAIGSSLCSSDPIGNRFRLELWREVLEKNGYGPGEIQVLVRDSTFLGLQSTDRRTQSEVIDEPTKDCDFSHRFRDYISNDPEQADEYFVEVCGAFDSEKTDGDPESSEPASDLDTELTHEAWTSTCPTTKPAPTPGTFWAVIDHAVEQEGNPWV